LNGHATQRLSNTTNISFHGVESEALLILLDKVGTCASSGSACLADSDEHSHVIKAMKPECNASRMIRFFSGRGKHGGSRTDGPRGRETLRRIPPRLSQPYKGLV
jgi:cysteine desulfurase